MPRVPGRTIAVKGGARKPLSEETDLIAVIQNDLKLIGLVGEEDAGLLVYLAYSSRYLPDPLSMIIKGVSSSGKSHIQRTPARLIPPSDIIDATSMSPQSLYYGEEGWLKNKVILGGERSHRDDPVQRDRTSAIRQMLSEGAITKYAVEDHKQVVRRQEGPIVYSETTTKESIFREDMNRCLQIDTDCNDEQTKGIMWAQGRKYKSKDSTSLLSVDVSEVVKLHHEFQEMLKHYPIKVPYIDELTEAVPTSKVEMRRVFPKLLALIHVTAHVNQFSRRLNGVNELEATVDDYAVARRLIIGPMHSLLGKGYDFARYSNLFDALPNGQFSTEEARQTMKARSRKVAADKLNRMQELRMVRCVSKKIGSPSIWEKLGEPDQSLLPSVETVRGFM